MSKRVARQRKKRAANEQQGVKRRPVIVFCALLSLILAVGIMAQWKVLPSLSKPLMIQPPPTGSFAANSPSKEYIYAGGRLIATEEPASGSQGNSQPINYALASNGGVATASSSYNANYPASAANNGDRKGLNWGAGGAWNDSGPENSFPDWLQTLWGATCVSITPRTATL